MKKTQDINSENYTPGTGGTAAFNVGSPGVWTGDVIEGGAGGAFYETGPRLDFEGIDAFTRANIANAAVLRRDATASLTASTTSDSLRPSAKAMRAAIWSWARRGMKPGSWRASGPSTAKVRATASISAVVEASLGSAGSAGSAWEAAGSGRFGRFKLAF
jgi:hypothetical protein